MEASYQRLICTGPSLKGGYPVQCAEEFANARVKTSQNLFLKPIGQRTGDQVFGKGSRWFLAALLTPELPKLFDFMAAMPASPASRWMAAGVLVGRRFMDAR
jgi:hypothetical protein